MPAAIPIAVAAISAAGSIGGGYLASRGAAQAAKAAGRTQTIPLPGYASAVNRMAARTAALNIGQQPPSFADYVKSGGTAQFPFISPGYSPQDLTQLGIVGKEGQPIPWGSPSQTSLTPEQKLFLGGQRYTTMWNSGQDVNDPLAVAYAKAHGLPTIQPKKTGGGWGGLIEGLLTGQAAGNLNPFAGMKSHKTAPKKGY